MARWSTGELLGRIVAFLFAGASVAFGVAILASWIAGLLGYTAGAEVIVPVTAVPVLALAWRIFLHKPSPALAGDPSPEEQS